MEIKDESRQGLTFSEGRFWSQTDAAIQQQDSHALPRLDDMLTLILKFIHTEDTASGVKKAFGKLDSSTLANAVTFSRKLLIFTADPDTDKQSLNRVLEAEEFTDLGSETRGRLTLWLRNNSDALTPYANLLDYTLFSTQSGTFNCI